MKTEGNTNEAMKNRIDFMIAGVQKAGTTSMDSALRKHPQIRMSSPKEMHYFDRKPHPKTEEDHQSYHERGWGATSLSEDYLYGESTPKYALALPDGRVPFLPRIRAYNPAIKLIFIFRDPVARVHSQWWMARCEGRSDQAFDDFVLERLNASDKGIFEWHALSRGFYGRIAEKALKLFPQDQLLFLCFEDFEKNFQPISEFLGVDSRFPLALESKNKGANKPQMELKQADQLRSYYADEMVKLQVLTGLNTEKWLPKS